jgi:excinuclease ABC subunit C
MVERVIAAIRGRISPILGNIDDIPGVGKMRKMALLKSFGDLAKIKSATVEAISKVEGIGAKQGRIIYDFLNKRGQP